MSVTTTSLRQGKFETRFWHKIFEEEVGRVKGHFGPINTCVAAVDSCSLFLPRSPPLVLLCTLQEYVTRQEERTVSFAYTTLTIRSLEQNPTATSRLRIRNINNSHCICTVIPSIPTLLFLLAVLAGLADSAALLLKIT